MSETAKVPWGYEYFKGDGETPFVEGSRVLCSGEWLDAYGDRRNGIRVFAPDCPYAIPVLVPNGWALIKPGERMPDEVMYKAKRTGRDGVWSLSESGNACSVVDENDRCWYARRIAAKPAPVEKPAPAEAVNCPACGVEISEYGRHGGGSKDCDLDGITLPLAVWRRLRIDPEPLVCPRCGTSAILLPIVKQYDTWYQGSCDWGKCNVRGPIMPTREQAESAFRQLAWKGAV